MARNVPSAAPSRADSIEPAAVCVTDLDGRIVAVAPAEDVMGRHWADFVPEEAVETVRAQLALVSATHRSQVVEHEWPRRELRRSRMRIVPLLAGDDVVAFVHVVLRPTEAETSPHEGIALADGDGRIVDADEVFGALLHVRASDLLGAPLPGFDPAWGAALDGGPYELPDHRLRGRRTSFVAMGRTLHLVQLEGRPAGMVWDLEAQRRHSHRLEALGVLASGVAHEINNPVQGILGFAQLIQARSRDGDDVYEFAGEIVNECGRVADIVASLLAFARRDGGRPSFVDARHLLRSTMLILGSTLRKSDIEVVVEVAEDLPPIPCRGHEIRQVLMNLLTNARDSLDEKFPGRHPDKRVQIEVRRASSGEAIAIVIEDRGDGMSPVVLDRIFDPFFTTKVHREGTGLGLSVSHGIVADHGGRLLVETEEGTYARFIVELPFEAR